MNLSEKSTQEMNLIIVPNWNYANDLPFPSHRLGLGDDTSR